MVMSLLANLFGKKVFADFSALKTDMHSHLLPGIDDGAAKYADSLAMINGLQELGFSGFITTPHVMKDVYNNSFENIAETNRLLNAALIEDSKIQISAAAEYYIDDDFPERIKNGEQLLTFGDNYVLIEMSMVAKNMSLESVVFELTTRGYKPVLAHAERYPYLFENQQLSGYERLADADVLLQVNIRSFIGGYGEIQKKIARKLAEHDMIDFLGTDLHNQSQIAGLQIAMHDPIVQKLILSDRLKNRFL
jgi:protein-tyrosine phosphatase